MNANGIFILGLNGCGKTTLGRALAERLGWLRMDVEDYYFPEMTVPYANPRPKDEVWRLMLNDIREHGNFVLSSVHADLSVEIRAHCTLAVWLYAPKALRVKRIEQRELARFGNRVMPGGDLYEQQRRFREFAAERDDSIVEKTVEDLNCQVLRLDATRPIDKNIEHITGLLAVK